MSTPLAVSLGANLILGAYIIVAIAGIVIGWFTVKGSGINNHPWDGHGTPGAKLPDQFHQFADWQVHEADLRNAEIERRVEARMAALPADAPVPTGWHVPHVHLPQVRSRRVADDMSLDEVNRRLAAEAAARKAAEEVQEERIETR
jgi:hypothetical protein